MNLHSPEQLEGDAQMVAEVEILLHVNNVVAVISVSSPHSVQDLQLYQSLMMKPAGQKKKSLLL